MLSTYLRPELKSHRDNILKDSLFNLTGNRNTLTPTNTNNLSDKLLSLRERQAGFIWLTDTSSQFLKQAYS